MDNLTNSSERFAWDPDRSILHMKFEPRPVLRDISIVIPTLGRPILEQSLYWIAVGSAWPGCLIVVEQGSNPDVSSWLQYLKNAGITVKHIPCDQRGRSAGINRGLEQVETKFVAITDDDCFVDTDWLENMLFRLREHLDAVVTGRVEAAGEGMVVIVTSSIPAIYCRPRLKFDSMSGGNMGTSIRVVNKVGLFDEDPVVRTAEDAEWSYRALCAGVPIVYSPDVCVWHFGWRDQANRTEQYYRYALSHGGFYGKYLRKGDFFILLRVITHHFRALKRWIRGLLTGNTETTLLGRAYLMGLLPGIVAGFRSRSRVGKST